MRRGRSEPGRRGGLPASAGGRTPERPAPPPAEAPAAPAADSPESLPALLGAAMNSWFDHRCSSKGAALAFYTLFSMTPVLLLAIAIAGYFFGEEAARGAVLEQLTQLVGPNGAQAVQALLAATRNPEAGLAATLLAGALLLVGATTVFAELKESLDEIWGRTVPPHSAIIDALRSRLLAFGIVLALGGLLLASLLIGAALAVLERVADGIWSHAAMLFSMLSSLVSYLVITALFAVIYKMLPAAPLSWRDVVLGAAFTAALFTLGKYAIGAYLRSSGITSGFGAAGSLIALLLWVYYSAQIFFVGAEFTRQYALLYGSLHGGGRERAALFKPFRRRAAAPPPPPATPSGGRS